jgi:alkylated DNA repair dioxygenase AlkB
MNSKISKYWTYEEKLIPSFVFEPLLEIIKEYCSSGINQTRISCTFEKGHLNSNKLYYSQVPRYEWNDAPTIIHEICKLVEDYTHEQYDYVLVHIYKDGNSSINYHYDSEALNSSVASVSLGATRKFRLKTKDRKTGWDHEILLNDGDLLWMHGPDPKIGRLSCQQVYLHCVPVEKKVKNPRINLTFRQK